MNQKIKRKYLDLFFKISIFLKGAFALIEIAGSFLILFITQNYIIKVASILTENELSEDTKDVISNYLLNAAHNFSLGDKTFIFVYLLSHGIIKLFLIFNLLKNKLWAYPISILVFGLFIVYQLYRYTYNPSLWLLALSAFDLIFIWLTWKEYQYVKEQIKL